jgi:hypothetical protein
MTPRSECQSKTPLCAFLDWADTKMTKTGYAFALTPQERAKLIQKGTIKTRTSAMTTDQLYTLCIKNKSKLPK